MIKLNVIHEEVQPFWTLTKNGWEEASGTRVTIQNVDFMFCISHEKTRRFIVVVDLYSGITVLKYYLNALDLLLLNDEDETRYFYDNSIIPELEKIILRTGIENLTSSLKAKKREMEKVYGKKAEMLTNK
ncbi:hypothetical protein [Listeria monocytogenes]|uniref:hypothetical protein n=1 Tax=Listeria monocytogenes TaxID=1639 RepID=UPI0010D16CFD|nr:hypothetical protein [Listeria monocytogenes]EAE1475539.1 hypothetical protein [Listeria monocytogenes]EBF5850566.1 hypothetical protein [Listeria monocytogenes]